jgi:hypothetical protein
MKHKKLWEKIVRKGGFKHLEKTRQVLGVKSPSA